MRDYWNLGKLKNANKDYQNAKRNFKKGKWKLAKDQYNEYIKYRNAIDYDAYFELGVCYFNLGHKLFRLKENKKTKNKKLSSSKEKDLDEEISKLFNKCLENVRKVEKYKPKKIAAVLEEEAAAKTSKKDAQNAKNRSGRYILQALGRVQKNKYEEHHGRPDFIIRRKKGKREYIQVIEAKHKKNNRA